MKTRLLIILGISATAFLMGVIVYPFINETTFDDDYSHDIQTALDNVPPIHPESEPNTIIIYDLTENDRTRLSIVPHTLVVNLTDSNIVRFVNDGSTTVNIFDKSKGIWRFDDVKPSSQRVLMINSTGFYEVLVQNSREGESGRIVVLDDDVGSLSVGNRIKMGKAIISRNFHEYPELVSVGGGGAEIGIHVMINKKELELHEDAESYYYEKYSKIVPFDVPIIIEFGEPIRLD
jgi:hypothetical protein